MKGLLARLLGRIHKERPIDAYEKADRKITVSVILPVYNVAPWIGECIESLKRQKLEGLEFIFVDDKSTDGSMKAVEAWASTDARVRIIYNKQNMGSGFSRNEGISIAKGEYLSFIDPDDYISDDYYSLLYQKGCEDGGHDLVKGSIRMFSDIDKILQPPDDRQNIRIQERLPQGVPLYRLFTYEHATAIYRRNLFDNTEVRYGSSKTAQDTTFQLRASYFTNDMVFEEKATYFYRIRQASATNTSALQRTCGELDAFDEKLDFLIKHGINDDSIAYIQGSAAMLLTRVQDQLGKDQISRSEYKDIKNRLLDLINSAPDSTQIIEKSPRLERLFKLTQLYANDRKVRVSVILPIYNPGEGIKDCISSLRRQLLEGLEFIFIDDRSTDGAMDAVEEWAAVDDRVRILHNEENIGAGASRNRGIEAARGEYLSFIDADDYVSPDFYEFLYAKAIQGKGYDIAKGCRLYVDEAKNQVKDVAQNERIKKAINSEAPLWHSFNYAHWSAIYKKSLFADPHVRYSESRVSEDVVFLLRVGSVTKSIAVQNNAVYYYVQRAGSLSNVYNKFRIEQMLTGLQDKRDALAAYGDSKYVIDFFSNHLRWCCNAISRSLEEGDLTKEDKRDLLKRFSEILESLPGHAQIIKNRPEVADLISSGLDQ